ncbi:hypothetical protein [Brachyspira sp. G79]|uniref:hypothetical protein n=1 Tax=Brachyspira sp. G79 TaxID=1358104 RepID=UPI000BBC2C4A|nr:hypothetical protein [Brachyspira sp. G79]PCG19464.1 hypothetical protein KQ44_05050 [Brachyspira sp. G79]
MKKIYLFLFIIIMFIISCNNKSTSPIISEDIGDITYYNPVYAETKQYSFYKLDHNTDDMFFTKSTFKKIAESKDAIIYLEIGIDKSKSDILNFLTEFEKDYPKEIEIYGSPSDIDQNGKIIFLMASLNTNSKEGDSSVGGYFSSSDLIQGKDGVRGEYLHVDATWNTSSVLGVMMHELQHLINYNVNVFNGNKAMDIWLNESLSESTSHLFSPSIIEERITAFNQTPYYSFYSWYFRYDDNVNNNIFGRDLSVVSYANASMFMKWLDINTGGNQEIYKKIASSSPSLDSEQRLVDSIKALDTSSALGADMNSIMVNWISDLNNNDLGLGVRVSALADSGASIYNLFIESGQTKLIPRALVVCTTSDADKINDSKVTEEDLGNGTVALLNNSKNANAGLVSQNNIVNISLTPSAAASGVLSSKSYNDLIIFKKDYFRDIIIK